MLKATSRVTVGVADLFSTKGCHGKSTVYTQRTLRMGRLQAEENWIMLNEAIKRHIIPSFKRSNSTKS